MLSAYTMHRPDRENDYWRLREFMRGKFTLDDRRERPWQLMQFDYHYWHFLINCLEQKLEDTALYWTDDQGNIIALVTKAGSVCFLHIHPVHYNQGLLNLILDAIDEHLFFKSKDGNFKTALMAADNDTLLTELVQGRGYARTENYDANRIRSLSVPIPEPVLPPGYRLRNMHGPADHAARSIASWDAFHHNEEKQFHGDLVWYANIEKMPCYRSQLDVVCTLEDDTIIGFCTVLYDDVNRTAILEPVGLVYEHHRQGIGRAMIHEGLRRVKNLGAETAYVTNNEEGPGKLYQACGFELDLMYYTWVKINS